MNKTIFLIVKTQVRLEAGQCKREEGSAEMQNKVILFLFQDIVFRIWVKYLSKLGVAFSDKSVSESTGSGYLNRQR